MAFTALAPSSFPWFDYSRYTFSLGLGLGGGAAILSGHTASAYDAERGKIVVDGDLDAQVRTAYAKIEAILGAGGLALSDVVRVAEYVRHDTLDERASIARLRSSLLAGADPVVNTIPVRALLRRDALLEVEVAARAGHDDDPLAGLTYLPSITAPAKGTIAEQMRAALDEAERMLDAHGLALDAICKVTQYVPAEALPSLDQADAARRERLGALRPALTRIPVDRLGERGSLVQLDVMASTLPLEPVDPGFAAFDVLGAAPAVRAGRVLFLSGQGGGDVQTGAMLHPGDVAAQAEDAYAVLAELLACASGDAGSLVKTVEYVALDGLAGYRDVGAVRTRYLVEPYPASTGLVQPVLAAPGRQFEVDALAVLAR